MFYFSSPSNQYPKGLGNTVSEIDVSNAKVFPKTVFSMMIPEVREHMANLPDVKKIVLFGIEVSKWLVSIDDSDLMRNLCMPSSTKEW